MAWIGASAGSAFSAASVDTGSVLALLRSKTIRAGFKARACSRISSRHPATVSSTPAGFADARIYELKRSSSTATRTMGQSYQRAAAGICRADRGERLAVLVGAGRQRFEPVQLSRVADGRPDERREYRRRADAHAEAEDQHAVRST